MAKVLIFDFDNDFLLKDAGAGVYKAEVILMSSCRAEETIVLNSFPCNSFPDLPTISFTTSCENTEPPNSMTFSSHQLKLNHAIITPLIENIPFPDNGKYNYTWSFPKANTTSFGCPAPDYCGALYLSSKAIVWNDGALQELPDFGTHYTHLNIHDSFYNKDFDYYYPITIMEPGCKMLYHVIESITKSLS